MHKRLRTTITLVLFGAITSTAQAQYTEEEQELLLFFGDEDLISIATGSYQPIAKAPAVASVITAEDIREMGATTLEQALETVPGLHVAINPIAYAPIYSIRGVYTQFNPQVLMLINGIPLQNVYQGNRHTIWGGMPVEAIKRIEVIRGPGSAIYGADAVAGVINIQTKTRDDIKQPEIGVRAGSFDTQEYWALYGDSWGDFEVAGMLEYRTTEGQRETIEEDGARFFGTSLAPGPLELSVQGLDARVDIAYQLWRLRAGLQHREDFGLGPGLGSALDPEGRYASDRINADFTYHNPEFTTNWDVKAQVDYLYLSQEVKENVIIYPPGTDLGWGPFPDGMSGNPEVFEDRWAFDLSAFYTGFERHKVRLGAGYGVADLFRAQSTQNFGLDPRPGPTYGTPLPADSPLVEIADGPFSFVPEKERRHYYFFIQDVWTFANDWELTAGMRYDDYSDFGYTVNPRLALVWSTRQNLTNKFLFGRAFRAPSFMESFIANNPVVAGNDELDPEIMRTVEWAIDYQHSDTLHLGANLFKYWWSDIIETDATSQFQNAGKQTGYGLELEATWQPRHDLNIRGNYAYQRSTDEELDHVSGNAPNHQTYVRVDWEFQPDWHLNTQLNWVGKRNRPAVDMRNDLDGYEMLDMTLRYKPANSPWEVALAGRNVLNTNAFEPTTGTDAIALPHDLPMAGRNWFVEVRYQP